MIDYLITGVAVAGLEFAYQRLLFPNHLLHFWFKKLYHMKSKLKYPLGLCHICNSVWIATLTHLLLFEVGFEVIITIGIAVVLLSSLIEVKWLIYVPQSKI